MTSPYSQGEEDRIAEDAAGWVARLQSSDATEQDRRDFERWLQFDPAHEAAYEEFKGLWTELKDVPIESGRLKKFRKSRRATGSVASVVMLVVLAGTLYRMGVLDRIRADYYTAVGEVRTVMLDDGTEIDLNTDTAITVRYTPGERRIHILRGEAFFIVAKNPRRPFIAEDGTLTGKALGTRYSMGAPSADFLGSVKVEEGTVEVKGGDGHAVLEGGNVATLTADGVLSLGRADVSAETAWRAGKLIFSNRPLRDVLATIARYRHGKIIILDQTAADQKVSGIFDLRDTEQALREIEGTLPVSVTRLTAMMVVVRSR